MTEDEFKKQYIKDIPMLEAWGSFVTRCIYDELLQRLGNSARVEHFLKIPPKPRVKTEVSILDKAFRRNKPYTDAYAEITDKVGVRFVVLLLHDIEIVTSVIESCPVWHGNAAHDRDFQLERIAKPFFFDYQSEHYIVRAPAAQIVDGVPIVEGTPCEIQVRTLLQHAYSEMAHDTIYKTTSRTDPKVVRQIARSMALIETTDESFKTVSTTLRERDEKFGQFQTSLDALYRQLMDSDPEQDPFLIVQIFEEFAEEVDTIDTQVLSAFFATNTHLLEAAKRNKATAYIYTRSVVLLLYYLISTYRFAVSRRWPRLLSDIAPIYTDLGMSL